MKKTFIIKSGAVEKIIINGRDAGKINIKVGKNSVVDIFDQGPTLSTGSDPDLHVKVIAESGSKISWYGVNENNTSLQVDLLGKKANVAVNELNIGTVESKSKRTVLINHIAPETQSAFLGFALMQNNSEHNWNVTTTIERKAKKSTANQRINNLLLGVSGAVKNHLALIIRNNDVICTHAVATGHLDEEQIFYAQARGLTIKKSKALMARGFVAPIFKLLPNDLEQELEEKIDYLFHDNAE
jgi:Fe-S cluster assembly protein SufD